MINSNNYKYKYLKYKSKYIDLLNSSGGTSPIKKSIGTRSFKTVVKDKLSLGANVMGKLATTTGKKLFSPVKKVYKTINPDKTIDQHLFKEIDSTDHILSTMYIKHTKILENFTFENIVILCSDNCKELDTIIPKIYNKLKATIENEYKETNYLNKVNFISDLNYSIIIFSNIAKFIVDNRNKTLNYIRLLKTNILKLFNNLLNNLFKSLNNDTFQTNIYNNFCEKLNKFLSDIHDNFIVFKFPENYNDDTIYTDIDISILFLLIEESINNLTFTNIEHPINFNYKLNFYNISYYTILYYLLKNTTPSSFTNIITKKTECVKSPTASATVLDIPPSPPPPPPDESFGGGNIILNYTRPLIKGFKTDYNAYLNEWMNSIGSILIVLNRLINKQATRTGTRTVYNKNENTNLDTEITELKNKLKLGKLTTDDLQTSIQSLNEIRNQKTNQQISYIKDNFDSNTDSTNYKLFYKNLIQIYPYNAHTEEYYKTNNSQFDTIIKDIYTNAQILNINILLFYYNIILECVSDIITDILTDKSEQKPFQNIFEYFTFDKFSATISNKIKNYFEKLKILILPSILDSLKLTVVKIFAIIIKNVDMILAVIGYIKKLISYSSIIDKTSLSADEVTTVNQEILDIKF